MRTIYLFLCAVLTVGSGYGQQFQLIKGAVNQNLAVNDSVNETFSLYVPADFETSKEYKVLFIMDPEGLGMRAARLFSSEIPTKDFVIAGNEWDLGDDLDKNMSKFFAMLRAVTNTIKLDQNHIYAAGRDEGAEVVSALPYVVTGFAGLLVVNDVFVRYNQRRFTIDEIYVGLVGNSSKNYYKMNSSFEYLKDRNKDNLLLKYSGDEGWPSGKYLTSAFSSLYFKVAENAKEELSDSLVRRSFKKDSATAEVLRRKRDFVIAYDYVDHLKDKYRGKMKLSPLRHQIRNLRRSTGYRNASRAANSREDDETMLRSDLSYFLEEDISMANFDNLAYWDQRVLELDSAIANEAKPQEQLVAKRVKGMLSNTMETYEQVYDSKSFSLEQALFFKILQTIFNPKDFTAFKDVISLAARDRDPDTANFYLKKMLDNGYDDYESLYDIPDTEILHISTEFNKIVKEKFGKSKF